MAKLKIEIVRERSQSGAHMIRARVGEEAGRPVMTLGKIDVPIALWDARFVLMYALGTDSQRVELRQVRSEIDFITVVVESLERQEPMRSIFRDSLRAQWAGARPQMSANEGYNDHESTVMTEARALSVEDAQGR
ncbi:MAG: hypothetical protein ACHREM_04235 [Polyangiales bacterium]